MYKIRNTGGLVGMRGATFAPGMTELSTADFDKLDKKVFGWWVEQGRLEIVSKPAPAPKPAAPKKATKKKIKKKASED